MDFYHNVFRSHEVSAPLLNYNLNMSKFIHLKYTIQWLFICLQSCITITTVNFRIFSSPQKETTTCFQSLPILPPPPPVPSIPNLPSESIDLCILDSSYINGIKQYEVLCDWLLSMSVFMVIHGVSVLHSFLLLNNIPLHEYTTFSSIISISGSMDTSIIPIFDYYKYCCYTYLCTHFCMDMCFHFLGWYLSPWIFYNILILYI